MDKTSSSTTQISRSLPLIENLISSETPFGCVTECVEEKNIIERKNKSTNNNLKIKLNDDAKLILPNPELIADIPEELLLGSVTVTPLRLDNNNGIQTVRSSARVIQKMKLDSIRPPTPPVEKKEQIKEDVRGPKTPSQSKHNRTIWSNNEKNLFFEALNEYGKDFESIMQYINTKSKKKNQTTDNITFKTREQVRCFYFQSFQKISKYLKFSDDVKKLAQELYTLINYGEMKRKLDFINEKLLLKLRDLVYKGHVTVRIKGKNVKIKTPSCKALRQLNQLDDGEDEIKLPSRIDIFLKPANISTWGKVQSIAQNPRVKTTLPIQRRVSSLIKTLQHKWRLQDLRTNEKLLSGSLQKNSLEHVNQEPIIRILPAPDAIIHRPMVSLTEFLSSRCISLNSYEERIRVKVRGEDLCSERVKRQRHDSNSETKKSPDHKKSKIECDIKPLEPCDKLEKIINLTLDDDEIKSPTRKEENEKSVQCSVENVQSDVNNEVKIINKPNKKKDNKMYNDCKRKDLNKRDPSNCKPLFNEEAIKKVRDGWTLLNIGDMTFGDLYIMFGSNLKLSLEYLFVEPIPKKNPIEISATFSIVSESFSLPTSPQPTSTQSKSENTLDNIDDKNCDIGSKLKQLIMIAHLMEQKKTKASCCCGHICDRRYKKQEDTTSFVSNKIHFPSQNDIKIFRSPSLPVRQSSLIDSYKYSMNISRNKHPKWLKVRNRTNFSTKQIVVQRMLPLQPGQTQVYDQISAPLTKENLEKSNSMLTEQMEKEKEKRLREEQDLERNEKAIKVQVKQDENNKTSTVKKMYTTNLINQTISDDKFDENDNSSAILKSPNVENNIESSVSNVLSNLPDISLSDSQNSLLKDIDSSAIKQLMEISLPSQIGIDSEETRYDGFLDTTPPMSPLKSSKNFTDDTSINSAWLSADINDFSFSSFLGHLDSLSENSRKNFIPPQTENTNLSLTGESSIDYMTKFAQIAAELKAQDNNNKEEAI